MRYRQPAIYIMTNKRNGTLYIGVTSHLAQRIFEHKFGNQKGFAKKYRCNKLVYYEIYDEMQYAISREKQLKAGSRIKKLALVEKVNPGWDDLYDQVV